MPIVLNEYGRASGAEAALDLWKMSQRAYAGLMEADKAALNAWLKQRWTEADGSVLTLHDSDCLAHAGTISQREDLIDRPTWFWRSLAGCRDFMQEAGEGSERCTRCVLVARPIKTLRFTILPLQPADPPNLVPGTWDPEIYKLMILGAAQAWCSSCGMDGLSCPASGAILVANPPALLNVAGFLQLPDLMRAMESAGA